MNCSDFRARRNYPADVAELAVLNSAVPKFHRGRPFATIGDTLQRAIDRVPDPLPPKFAARLAATLLAEAGFSRVLRAVLSQGRRAR